MAESPTVHMLAQSLWHEPAAMRRTWGRSYATFLDTKIPRVIRYNASAVQSRRAMGRDLERWQQQSEQVEPWRVREPKVARMKALRKSLEISRQALKSAAYCQDFRSMIEGDIHDHGYGHRGLVWRSVKFDGWTGEPADIYLLFHKEDIHPAPNHGAA